MSKQSMWLLGIGLLLGVAALPFIVKALGWGLLVLFFYLCAFWPFHNGDCW